jgi:glycogen debranching enzyme
MVAVCLGVLGLQGGAQNPIGSDAADGASMLTSDAATAGHFFAAHGRRALIDGNSSGALEVWIYPFQILRNYQVKFQHPGATTTVDGKTILSRVDYGPASITRIYIGPDFIAREKLMVPLDKAVAVISYSIESAVPLKILVHATPVLNLMWPAGLGGQSAAWKESLPGFVLSEPLHGISATVGSGEIAAHDAIANRTTQNSESPELGFTLQPDEAGNTSIIVMLNAPHTKDPEPPLRDLIRNRDRIGSDASAHLAELQKRILLVKTPDEEVNRAIADAEIALDQAWVCNEQLGCGFVGGYGPTRPVRRPQYDWFFAGDGLVAADGALSDGDRDHARDELEFILRYQDKKTGMIWHELSQSAGFIDWASKYPYMFVHVDITFQFLETAAHYVRSTGDIAFARTHWDEIQAAYRYCRALIDPATALPRIPTDKEGGNEQERMTDDLGLSTSWVAAAKSMADLAKWTGHSDVAFEAAQLVPLAQSAILQRYWDAQQSFWISCHDASGRPMRERRSEPSQAISMHLFDEPMRNSLLNELASASFQTDWGTRSIAVGSAGYDPQSYAQGSVWPVSTAAVANTFWSEHRPTVALSIWRALVPLASMDSVGHMHEVLAGDFYHPQMESVPEQTWSSAGFLTATFQGLLGLEIDATTNQILFAPRIPADWSDISVEHICLPGGLISLALHRSNDEVTLKIENEGDAFSLQFDPDLPLGAQLLRTQFDGRPATGKIIHNPQETTAHVEIKVPHGASRLAVGFKGGITVIADSPHPRLGEPNTGIHIVDVHLDQERFTIDADVSTGKPSHLQLESAWPMTNAVGAVLTSVAPNRIQLALPAEPENKLPYRRAHVVLHVSTKDQ